MLYEVKVFKAEKLVAIREHLEKGLPFQNFSSIRGKCNCHPHAMSRSRCCCNHYFFVKFNNTFPNHDLKKADDVVRSEEQQYSY